jgi:rubrerythrin
MQEYFAKDLIAKAVKKEEEADKLYTDAAAKAQHAEVKKLFVELAEQEREHKKILLDMDMVQLEKSTPQKISDPKLTQIAEPTSLSDEFTLQEAILFAIKREDEAHTFYKEFAALAEDQKLKNVFENLAAMEMGHKTSLESMYEQNIYNEN